MKAALFSAVCAGASVAQLVDGLGDPVAPLSEER